ncbi:hypothetical protein TruAng_009677 [Truncatella angustata]|nr:hypothetical protein TruAng_009677 [Truncatella angustata]
MQAQQVSRMQEYPYDPTFAEYGTEDPSKYNKGGFHPVHLGDILDGRFEVVHKLGNGGYGSVWLCWDQKLSRWSAVKVLAALPSTSGGDTKVLIHLRKTSSLKEIEANHIALPLEDFWIDGPNGRHLCFIMPVLGPSVDIWRGSLNRLAPETGTRSRVVCKQIAEAIRFLHEKGICHNDLKPANILMKLNQEVLNKLSKNEVLEILGEPDEIEVETVSGVDPRPIAPEYCVAPSSFYGRNNLITDDIALIDFGESFLIDALKEGSGIPLAYAAPEILFNQNPGLSTDIWSLACTIYQVRSDEVLLGNSYISGALFTQIVHSIELLLGPLPEVYRGVWNRLPSSRRRDSSPEDDNGPATCSAKTLRIHQEEIKSEKGYPQMFSATVGQQRATVVGKTDDTEEITSEWTYSRGESLSLGDLLQKMLKYSPDERSSVVARAIGYSEKSKNSSAN